jgi:hypothetical protein
LPKFSISVSLITHITDRTPSDTLVTPVTSEPEDALPWASAVSEDPPPGLRRRKKTKVKGYCIYSEEERSGESDCYSNPSEYEMEETDACSSWEPSISPDQPPNLDLDSLEIRTSTHVPATVSIIFPSILPLAYVTDTNSVASGTSSASVASFASSTFDTLTYHRELREAQVDSDFDRILARLISEWYYTGASVCVTLYPLLEMPGLTILSSFFQLPRNYLLRIICAAA